MHHNLHLDNLLAYVNYIAATDMISSYLFLYFYDCEAPAPIIWDHMDGKEENSLESMSLSLIVLLFYLTGSFSSMEVARLMKIIENMENDKHQNERVSHLLS